MSKVIDILNNRVLIAIVVGLFVLSSIKMFAGRR